MQKTLFGSILSVIFASSGWAATTTLYSGSVAGTPASQGYLSHYSLPSGGSETVAGGATTYSSTATSAEQGGYSSYIPFGPLVNSSFPSLNRAQGYTVSLDAKLLSETHTSANRAGLALIVLSSDHVGIELSFWPTEIWAQSGPTFTHAEGVSFDPTAANTSYDLTIQGSTYALTANGASILTGALRDYSGFGYPYTLNNFLFLGDDTGEALGSFSFSRLAVTVPEPTSFLAAAAGAALLMRRRPQLA